MSNGDHELRVLSFNVWGLAFISKDRKIRIKAIAEYLSSSTFDIVCLQELWIYKDFELVRDEVLQNLPFSRFFNTGALGSGLAIFTRYPIISAHALPYSLSGSPYQVIAGDFFVKKAAANVVISHPLLGQIEIWNTHMHAAGESGPETDQAHRMAQAWQLSNAVQAGAERGRYILTMGDFNSQPWSVPIALLLTQGQLQDSFLDNPSTSSHGATCDSPLNTYSAGKPIPQEVLSRGGKRLDYIFYRQPTHGASKSLRCSHPEIMLTEKVPGHPFSYSDHFGLCSTFLVEDIPPQRSSTDSNKASSLSPLLPRSTGRHDNASKTESIRDALAVIRSYAELSRRTAKIHLRLFFASIVLLVGLTVGSAFQPKSYLQPIFTLVGGALGAGGATMLYTGFIWGRWEAGLLSEVTDEMELELRAIGGLS